MDAAYPNPLEHHRLVARPRAQSELMKNSRLRSTKKRLSEDEFACAVSDTLPHLVAIARRLTADDTMAAEAVQNALLKASKSWKRFRGEAQIETWLTRIVIHAVRDLIADENKRSSRCELLPAEELEQSRESTKRSPDDPQRIALDQERHKAIHDAVRKLPHRQREVFTLVVWHAMPAREVSELLEIETQNVHANMHAARKQLKEMLRPYYGND